MMVLAGAISGVLLLFSASMASSDLAWDTTVATSHGEHVLEEMQSRDSLPSILEVDWKAWAAGQGLNTLPRETVEVVFADTNSNPLGVQVSVDWVRKSRAGNITLKTRITK